MVATDPQDATARHDIRKEPDQRPSESPSPAIIYHIGVIQAKIQCPPPGGHRRCPVAALGTMSIR